MEALLEALLELCGYFEPATSAEILAVVGAVSLAALFAFSMYLAGRAASQGMGQVFTGLQQLLHAIVRLGIALILLWLTVCLVRAAPVHILH